RSRVGGGPGAPGPDAAQPPPRQWNFYRLAELVAVEPATDVALQGGWHGTTDQHSYYVSCHYPGSLSHQHAADRWTSETNRSRHRHHYRRAVVAEISRRLLAFKGSRGGGAVRCRRRCPIKVALRLVH